MSPCTRTALRLSNSENSKTVAMSPAKVSQVDIASITSTHPAEQRRAHAADNRPTRLPRRSPYSDSDQDEYIPAGEDFSPPKRGRRSHLRSHSAREMQRKLNHSRIEKARRTKINDALATLSILVKGAAQAAGEIGEEQADGKAAKEYKLDVLVKAVAYIQELLRKVEDLEVRPCPYCVRTKVSPHTTRYPLPTSPPAPPTRQLATSESSAASYASAPVHGGVCRLPPISSWLRYPQDEPLSPTRRHESSPHTSAAQPHSSKFPATPLPELFQLKSAPESPPAAHSSLASPSTAALFNRPSGQGGGGALDVRYASTPACHGYHQDWMPGMSPSWTSEDEAAAGSLMQLSS